LFLYKHDRINLARIQLSYNLPKKILAKTFIKDMGVYVCGNDLLLLAMDKELMERTIGNKPQTRFYSVGVKAVF